MRRIEDKVPTDPAIFASDYDIQDIIAINLERVVQSCVDLAAHVGSDFDDYPLRARNQQVNLLSHLRRITPSLPHMGRCS